MLKGKREYTRKKRKTSKGIEENEKKKIIHIGKGSHDKVIITKKNKKERYVRNKVHERKMDLCRGMKKIKKKHACRRKRIKKIEKQAKKLKNKRQN